MKERERSGKGRAGDESALPEFMRLVRFYWTFFNCSSGVLQLSLVYFCCTGAGAAPVVEERTEIEFAAQLD